MKNNTNQHRIKLVIRIPEFISPEYVPDLQKHPVTKGCFFVCKYSIKPYNPEETMEQNIFDLSRFNEYREGNRLEIKSANKGLPNNLWDTYSSFSNCSGGAIILGVKEREDGSLLIMA